MPRPGNIRLRRARYADLSGGPMKFGLAPTVGKGHHFWRLNRTGGGPKCCKPPILPYSLELTFDASNGAILYVKFDSAVTTMTKLTDALAGDTFKKQFKVSHDPADVSFVNLKAFDISKAYFNTSKNKTSITSTTGKVGKYLVIELDMTNKADHIPMLDENYVVEYTPSATKGLRVIMNSIDNGELAHSKQKGKASNSFNFEITDISGVTSGTDADKKIAVTFSHKVSKVNDISNAFAVTTTDINGTTSSLTVSDAAVDDTNPKKVILTMSKTVTLTNKHTVTYNPLEIADAKQNNNYLKLLNANNVQNYRAHKVAKEEANLN